MKRTNAKSWTSLVGFFASEKLFFVVFEFFCQLFYTEKMNI